MFGIRVGKGLRARSLAVAGVAVLAGIAAAPGPAGATLIHPTSVTASSSFSGYPAADAIDTGGNFLTTDWASNGQGTSSTLELSFPTVETFTSVQLYDRTSSGGVNGSQSKGVRDFTTEFSLQACNTAACTTLIGSPHDFFKSVPVSPSSPADFKYTTSLTGLTGQYLLYSVLAINPTNTSLNPGLAAIQFDVAVPEPTTLALLGGALLGFGIIRRRRSARSA